MMGKSEKHPDTTLVILNGQPVRSMQSDEIEQMLVRYTQRGIKPTLSMTKDGELHIDIDRREAL